jgi:hypothetical protein
MPISLGRVSASVRKRFRDTFTRSDVGGSLGKSSDGSDWNATKGTFSLLSNKAQGYSTDYQIATQTLPFSDADITIKDVTQGTGAAIWVTDSGNWWAVGADTGSGQDCNCQTCSNASYYAGSYSAPSYYAGNTYSCNCQTCSNSSYYAGSYSPPSYYAGNTYSCGCTTCYNSGNPINAFQSSNGPCPAV